MAKSLRSKSRRRNVKAKREVYNAKAIIQLKKTLGLTKEAEKIRKAEIMRDLSEMTAAVEALNKKLYRPPASDSDDVEMEQNGKDSDGETKDSTLKLKDGQNPIWKNQRKIKAAKKARKIRKNKQKKIEKTKKGGKKN